MNSRLLLLVCTLAVATAVTASEPVFAPIKVSDNGRYLVHTDDTPFLYLADTAWELFHRLNREEAIRYLDHRAQQGFTVIQAVAISELGGPDGANAYGEPPFQDGDIARPNEGYFAHVDWIVDQSTARGLYVALLPTWGHWVGSVNAGGGRENYFHEGNAGAYGAFLASRYQNRPVIWVLGGDVLPERGLAAWDELARGIRGVVGKKQLITYHPSLDYGTTLHGRVWLDFNMMQSAHFVDSTNYESIARDYAREPVKPCMDGEPAYEFPQNAMPAGIPVGEVQVRRLAYWALFAGAHGHAYGTHPIWQMYDEGREALWHVSTPWHQAMDLPGANQMKFVKRLMLSRPFLTRIPDQTLVTAPETTGIEKIVATRDGSVGNNDATYLMVYFPRHHRATINTSVIAGTSLRVTWYNPRTGESTSAVELANGGTAEFEPPTNGEGEDWILIVDDGSKGYGAP